MRDSPWLHGIHWWGYTQGEPIDTAPARMLGGPGQGGWDVEVILTHGSPWWTAEHFAALYKELTLRHRVTLITRIDYNWGQTLPPPGVPAYSTWSEHVVEAVDTLSPYAHLWIIGNEPNLHGEATDWYEQKIPPEMYAASYRRVRRAIHHQAQPSPRGPHRVLVAPMSPAEVQPGVLWLEDVKYLERVIDAIPNDEIDGLAIHAYGGTVAEFHDAYRRQLELIDAKGLADRPVYLTEWNKVADEAEMARFARAAFADVHRWNQTQGRHDIVCMCWFVYDADQQGSGMWDKYSIEYFRAAPTTAPATASTIASTTAPAPASGQSATDDLYATFKAIAERSYPAGRTRAPADLNADDKVNAEDVRFFSDCMTGPEARGVPTPCASADRDGDGDVDQADFERFISEAAAD